MQDRDLFVESYKAAKQFPENVVRRNIYMHVLETYRSMLNERSGVLFCAEGKALVRIWEYCNAEEGPTDISVSSVYDLKANLEGKHFLEKEDPGCRYIFIHARHSRDRLQITFDMFLYAMTYHQVMPEFLEFIFPFGWQEYQEDFHFGGFRAETRFLPTEEGLNIPELGRSGKDFRICYALKSAERSSEKGWPWSIRQTALYLSFEIDTGKTFWIIVKGNDLMRNRIQNETKLEKQYGESAKSSFVGVFDTHLIVCGWAVENWRWYINFLEKRLEDLTRHSLAIRVAKAQSVFAAEKMDQPQPLVRERSNSTWKRLLHVARSTSRTELTPSPDTKPRLTQTPSSGSSSPISSPDLPPRPPPPTGQVPSSEPELSFHDIQEIQFMEDKLNTAIQVLINNTKVLQELEDFYISLIELPQLPSKMKIACQPYTENFIKRVKNSVTDLQMHRSRAETLLRLLADRKTLLYGILDYRAMEANRLLAKRAQESAERMEQMAKEMNIVTLKTKDETVSMKIITLVTLFYLPGTFMSTVMSTDIIKFPSQEGGFQWPALRIWLEVTVPLMVITFLAWLIVHKIVERDWFRKRNERKSSFDV